MGYTIGAVALVVLVFVEIIHLIVGVFTDTEEFAGFLLIARPIVVFVGMLLTEETFWAALEAAVLWSLVAMGISLLCNAFSSHSSSTSSGASRRSASASKPRSSGSTPRKKPTATPDAAPKVTTDKIKPVADQKAPSGSPSQAAVDKIGVSSQRSPQDKAPNDP